VSSENGIHGRADDQHKEGITHRSHGVSHCLTQSVQAFQAREEAQNAKNPHHAQKLYSGNLVPDGTNQQGQQLSEDNEDVKPDVKGTRRSERETDRGTKQTDVCLCLCMSVCVCLHECTLHAARAIQHQRDEQ
jgi:hypothetical protein